MIKYQPKLNELIESLKFLTTEYRYSLKDAIDYKFMGTMKITYIHNQMPTITIEMERYILSIKIFIQNQFIDLFSLQKFLEPDKIFKNWNFYRCKRNFKNFFYIDIAKGIKFVIHELPKIEISEYFDFYNKYPYNVWKWIEK